MLTQNLITQIKVHQQAVGQAFGFLGANEQVLNLIDYQDMLNQIEGYLPFTINSEQHNALLALLHYFFEPTQYEVFVLQGAAGTGKTTILSAFVQWLSNRKCSLALAAPTGRSAKVLASKVKQKVFTLHKLLYNLHEVSDDQGLLQYFSFQLKANSQPAGTIYFVDEASMIAENAPKDAFLQNNSLLDDLLCHVFEPNIENKLVFVGDKNQLPPVGEKVSIALTPELLQKRQLNVRLIELNLIQRQLQGSPILEQASAIIAAMNYNNHNVDNDAIILPHDESSRLHLRGLDYAADFFVENYQNDNNKIVFLTHSNKMAHVLNAKIRKRLFGEVPILPQVAEPLLLVKNHYFQKKSGVDYWANGETPKLIALDNNSIENLLNLQFAEIKLAFTDFDGYEQIYNHKALLNLLNTQEPSLSPENQRLLFMLRRKSNALPITDPYQNALQLKYGYAITTHKAQGGEWPIAMVLLERNYGNELDTYLRWLYTAVTRATQQLVLVFMG